MNRSLYFMSLIVKTLDQADPQKALVKAFRDIESLAKDPEHGDGYANFLMFMAEVAANRAFIDRFSDQTQKILFEDLALQLTAEVLTWPSHEGAPSTDWIGLLPPLDQYLAERIRVLMPEDASLPHMMLNVRRDELTITSVDLDLPLSLHYIGGILPGKYAFKLGSGRLLWEVGLGEKDLLLKFSESGKNLRLAADTGEDRPPSPTRKMASLNGELVFRVFAGLESGWIEIETRKPE